MNVTSIHNQIDTRHLPLESLAGNTALTEQQKIAEASRQFEAVLLRQFLTEAQKPVIKSEYSDNSTAAGIYKDFINNQLADSLARSGGFGVAENFTRQLTKPAPLSTPAPTTHP